VDCRSSVSKGGQSDRRFSITNAAALTPPIFTGVGVVGRVGELTLFLICGLGLLMVVVVVVVLLLLLLVDDAFA